MKLQIAIDGKTYEAEVEVLEDDALPRQPNFGPYSLAPATIQTPARVAPVAAPVVVDEKVADESKVLRSPVNGIVIKVDAKVGDEFVADQLLVILEAMKMETNVTAPAAGKVKGVRIKEGDSVKSGQVIVEFE